MRGRILGGIALALFLSLLIIGCGSEDPVNVVQPDNLENNNLLGAPLAKGSAWHDLSDTQRNQKILEEAESWAGQKGGQCKEWVRAVVKNASGGIVNIPSTYTGAGTYYLAKWTPEYPSSDAAVVRRSTSNICNYWSSFSAGQIVQMRHDYKGATPHTMIIILPTPWGFWVGDSNWYLNEKVYGHWISSSWFSSHLDAWTVYQIK